MRFAVGIPNFGDFADPRVVADLARRAEQAGWDGLLGPLVTPVARRRVSKLAREVTTLDRLTAGRMILGAPIADEFGSFGETTGPRELAARLAEALEALNLLWSGPGQPTLPTPSTWSCAP